MKLAEKLAEYQAKYRIWRKDPTRTFKQVSDIWSKEPILKAARLTAVDVLKRDLYMFNEVCNAILTGDIIRKAKLDKRTIVDILTEEDKTINECAAGIRTEIMEYLAHNSEPNIEESLVLVTLVIDLERLGDYTKDLAKLTLLSPPDFENKRYMADIRRYQKNLTKMFNETLSAFEKRDRDTAKNVMEMNIELRNDTDRFMASFGANKNVGGKEALMFTLYARFFRRVAAHLENIASSVVSPFPYLGFKHAPNLKLRTSRDKMSNILKEHKERALKKKTAKKSRTPKIRP